MLQVTELVTGKALVCAHGKVHERQKKIMAPTFFASQLKVYLPMFHDAASKVFSAYPLGIIAGFGVLDDDGLPSVLIARAKVER